MQSYLSLQQFLLNIQGKLKYSFPESYWIKAELAGVRKVGKHVYFELIQLSSGQKVAQIRGTAFHAEGTQAISEFEMTTGQKFADGIKIGLRATVNYHPVYGLSLNLLELDAELTIGGIELQRKQTLEQLLLKNPGVIMLRDGLYSTPNKLLPIPLAIQRVAVITSLSSDAFADFMHCLKTNDHDYHFYTDIYEALVHGYSTTISIMAAMDQILASGKKYDVVVLIRGGGAPADFLPFDDYDLALRVATFSIPIVTGIGHQMNQGIADFFARIHMKTPTMAAQYMIDYNAQFESRLYLLSESINKIALALYVSRNNQFLMLQSKIVSITKGALQNKTFQLFQVESNLVPSVFRVLKNEALKLEQKSLQISFRLPFYFTAMQKNLLHLQEHIQSLSPQRLLKRGFVLIKKNGTYVVNEKLNPGEAIEIIQETSIYQAEIIKKL
ncbi:exodeoxyribonuclease VII large subunit [Arcticibacter eurypsychrophilus]|uniref:exodeoxyribonuclease VII large subunit n=1 Tax=Arcticibacter eurypsychrophilus TaxID=1434752 RepID=UPI00084DECE7|nr:exodeoxyribonuclease VII large subunit [Arcticibacter eurypsychrophilus]